MIIVIMIITSNDNTSDYSLGVLWDRIIIFYDIACGVAHPNKRNGCRCGRPELWISPKPLISSNHAFCLFSSSFSATMTTKSLCAKGHAMNKYVIIHHNYYCNNSPFFPPHRMTTIMNHFKLLLLNFQRYLVISLSQLQNWNAFIILWKIIIYIFHFRYTYTVRVWNV